MNIPNKVMLITYPDSLGRNIGALNKILNTYFKKSIGGVHLLPFFPSSGDRGFAPKNYDVVDDSFGNWTDVKSLSNNYYLMFDFMVNHLSKHSKEFKDFYKNGMNSRYKDMFIDWDKFWPKNRPTKQDIDLIYKRKDKAPYQEIKLKDGTPLKLWNTFSDEQLDLNVNDEQTKQLIDRTFKLFASNGAAIVRLDAFAYAVKKLDTNDFFVEPEIWDLLEKTGAEARKNNLMILPEIHEEHSFADKVSRHGYFTYDFVLPILILFVMYSKKSSALLRWLKRSPMKQFTTLDTHDGIGVVDAKGVLSDKEIKYTTNELYKTGSNVKRVYSSATYNNLDIYQINTTYYSALGQDDAKYILSRAIQVFSPGIPQVYYVGLLAGKNDLELLEKTKEGRNINRHYYTNKEVSEAVERPVVHKLLNLLEYRNQSKAFDLSGSLSYKQQDEQNFSIFRADNTSSTISELRVNLNDYSFEILENGKVINL